MNLLVTGSRGWRAEKLLRDKLDAYRFDFPKLRILQGGAAGADRQTYDWSLERDIPCATFAPDYSRPSPQRYHERNDRMLELADYVLAFWDGESRGTFSVIKKAQDKGLPVEVVRP